MAMKIIKMVHVIAFYAKNHHLSSLIYPVMPLAFEARTVNKPLGTRVKDCHVYMLGRVFCCFHQSFDYYFFLTISKN